MLRTRRWAGNCLERSGSCGKGLAGQLGMGLLPSWPGLSSRLPIAVWVALGCRSVHSFSARDHPVFYAGPAAVMPRNINQPRSTDPLNGLG